MRVRRVSPMAPSCFPSPHRHGKLTSAGVLEVITRRTDVHYPRPKVVTLAQSTEMSPVYQKGEISGISRIAQEHGLKVHMDGARFANAVAALKVAPADITWRSAPDVPRRWWQPRWACRLVRLLSFLIGKLGGEFSCRCKQAGQLASKMRLPLSPLARHVDRRHLAAPRRPCQRHGAPPISERIAGIAGAEVLLPPRSERRVRQPARAAAARL